MKRHFVRRTLVSSLILGTLASSASPAAGATASGRGGPQRCGPTWEIVPSPGPGDQGNSLGSVVAFSATDAWAAGTYTHFNPFPQLETRPLFTHWDGSGWLEIPNNSSPGTHFITGMTGIDPNNLWAVGPAGYIEHWDGVSWSEISAPDLGVANLSGVSGAGADDIWTAGSYYPGPRAQTFIAHWDGSTWAQVASPNRGTQDNYLYDVAALDATHAWAVGTYTGGNGTSRALVERWDGTAWTIVPVKSPTTISLYPVAVAAPNIGSALMAGWSADQGGSALTLIERWNGAQWRHGNSPNVPGLSNFLYDVAVGATRSAWAVGNAQPVLEGSAETLIERFSSGTWTIDSSANEQGASNELRGVAASPDGDVWAVGDYVPSGQPSLTLIEHLCL